MERYGIAWHEKTLGQLFCDGSSRQILDMLLAECEAGKVELILNARSIAVEKLADSGFRVASSAGEFIAGAVVVATGGLSIPKLGATGLGYEIARQFGLRIVPPRPALVPLVLGGEEVAWTELAGVATEAIAWTEPRASKRAPTAKETPRSAGRSLKQQPFREKMLVTHRGLSGPAILQASSYWRPGDDLVLDLAPDAHSNRDGFGGLLGELKQPRARRDEAAFRQALRSFLPQRLAAFLAETAAPQGWSNPALDACERKLHALTLHPVGTEGFEKAEVTAGGVDTDDLNARNLESRAVPGLYFIGEVVDVTGWLGGFNFQWAWASGTAAGRAV